MVHKDNQIRGTEPFDLNILKTDGLKIINWIVLLFVL
jgi:hypothetical protein